MKHPARSRTSTRSRAAALFATGVLGAVGAAAPVLPGTPASVAAPAPGAAHADRAATVPDGWRARTATYPGTVARSDLAIAMSDGTVLRGDLELPAGADGRAAAGRFPVLVTITAYNKSVAGSSLGEDEPGYLVRRGYASLTVDARGTGSSEGT